MGQHFGWDSSTREAQRTDSRTGIRQAAVRKATSAGPILETMLFLADKASASLQRIRRWAELSAAYSNGDHFAVSGQDGLSALAGRASEDG